MPEEYLTAHNPQAQLRMFGQKLNDASGAPVHFAISQSEVMMTTRLDGAAPHFLSFNNGQLA